MNRPKLRPAHAALLLAAAAACRQDDVAHYRVGKERAEPAAVAQPAGMTGDLPPPPAPEGGTLRWTLPKGWTQEKGGAAMRYATLKAPVPGRLDVSVVVLPGPAGGELANVNRWRNQIGLAPIDDAALAKARAPVATKAGPISLYDFTSEGQTRSRVVAGLATVEGSTWFIKMTGDAAAVAAARPDFIRLVESLRLDAAN